MFKGLSKKSLVDFLGPFSAYYSPFSNLIRDSKIPINQSFTLCFHCFCCRMLRVKDECRYFLGNNKGIFAGNVGSTRRNEGIKSMIER